MISSLSNGKVTIEVNSVGAELWSIKKANETFDYLWQGDSTYWTGRSPVLFPNVGAVKNNVMRVEGKEYPLGNHGFPRKLEFELKEKSESKLTYAFTYDEDSLQMYPFKFILELTYTLIDTTVRIDYKVINTDNKTLYFQLGTHAGFNLPMEDGLTFDDYYLEFDQVENSRRLYFDAANLLVSNKDSEGLSGTKYPLNFDLFKEGACIFRHIQSSKITLKSDKNDRNVSLEFNKFPYLGIWQKQGAPYICIEPWYGISDTDDYCGEFKDKEMMLSLEKTKEYMCYLAITVF